MVEQKTLSHQKKEGGGWTFEWGHYGGASQHMRRYDLSTGPINAHVHCVNDGN